MTPTEKVQAILERRVPNDAQYDWVHDVVREAVAAATENLAYKDHDLSCGLSWDSKIICGDKASITYVQSAIHSHEAVVPDLRDQLTNYVKTVDALLAKIAAPQRALTIAASQFRLYAGSHAAKGTADGDAKARANTAMAELCEAALQS